MVRISVISMLPKGKISTDDPKKLLVEKSSIASLWKMLEYHFPWYKGELIFGYIPTKFEEAYLFQKTIENVLVNQANFSKEYIICPYKVDKLEWQQTLWRFYWLWQIAIENMENIWSIVKNPTDFISIEERNDYLRAIAFISAIPPGRVMILDKRFRSLMEISQKVKSLETEATKYCLEVQKPFSSLWPFPELSTDRAFYIFSEEEFR